MCGIAGFIDPQTAPAERAAAVDRMCAALFHRGPDDGGTAERGEANLGMRRLAIFDPANGHQPMVTPDGRYTLIFNGAIYNHRALRAELEGGWTFRTHCDTEVLLAAFARWGEACLGRLRGMYAFAVWDAADDRLFLARDPFGIKPLYYRQDGRRLLFASELNALIASGAAPAEIDPRGVADYLAWFAVPAPRTIYRNMFCLRPGECASFRHGELAIRPTWSFRTIPADIPVAKTQAEFTAGLRAQLDDSIRAHVLADVPVGAFLSGGLDSAVVVGLMTRASGARLRTFSIGFEEAAFSEAEAAAASARHFGSEHHASVVTGTQVAGDVEKFLAACDQPTGDGLNTYYVSQAAHAGGVTVALSGLGGDELFGGYPSFRVLPRLSTYLPWWRRLPGPVRRFTLRRLRRGDTRRRKLADFLEHARDRHELAAMQRRVFSEPRRRALLSGSVRELLRDLPPFHPELPLLRSELAETDDRELASAWELRTYMADLLLRDSDVMSMRHSLELRVPFVDRPLIEWLWRQAPEYRFTPGRPKDALAAATADLLPPGMRDRRKQGFALPMAEWMRGALRPFLEDTFSGESLSRSRWFDRGTVQSSWRSFLDRDDSRNWSRVWSLAVLIAFVNRRPAAAVRPSLAAPAVTLSSPPARPRAAAPAHRPIAARPRGKAAPATLLMAPEIFSAAGGIQRILQLYLRALTSLGLAEGRDVKLVALNDSMLDSSDVRRAAETELSDWAVCNRDKRRFLRETIRLSRGCDRIICGHVAQLPVAWAASRLRPRLHYYLVAHGIEVWRSFTIPEKLALRGAKRIFCVSEYTRQELLRRAPVNPARAVVLANGLDPYFEIAAGAPLASCPPVILSVARLSRDDRYKGVENLVAAMVEVRRQQPAARLRIVGQGDDRVRLQAAAQRLGILAEGVEFLGHLDDAQLTEEFRTCRLFALPSVKEGFGLVYLEAMAHGRPCLGARAAATPEVITPETGVLVEPGNDRSIAEGLIHGLRHPWNEAAILARARSFSYPVFRDRLAALLQP
jgi:asparagine synthase (glutamine-hydrolysing)